MHINLTWCIPSSQHPGAHLHHPSTQEDCRWGPWYTPSSQHPGGLQMRPTWATQPVFVCMWLNICRDKISKFTIVMFTYLWSKHLVKVNLTSSVFVFNLSVWIRCWWHKLVIPVSAGVVLRVWRCSVRNDRQGKAMTSRDPNFFWTL